MVGKMTHKIVTLSEREQLCYSVQYFDHNESSRPQEYADLSAELIDGHYIMSTTSVSCRTLFKSPEHVVIFGVSHTAEEADKRLYERGKEIAEDVAKRNAVEHLEDLTRHYQSLPIGGK